MREVVDSESTVVFPNLQLQRIHVLSCPFVGVVLHVLSAGTLPHP
jgi:hypothetical protein